MGGGAGPGREVAALELHPLQKALAQDDVQRLVEQTLITVVNQATPPAPPHPTPPGLVELPKRSRAKHRS